MIGFRSDLSTQDVMLILHHHVIRRSPDRLDSPAVLALDLTKAFDNVGHESILKGLQSINPGVRTYNYIEDFLSDRTAVIHVSDLVTPIFSVGGRGTPQRAVLSPLLFNLAILKIPKKLEKIPGLHINHYADDITLLANRGSDAQIEEIPKMGIDIVIEEAGRAGLSCSASKSELLLRPSPAQRPPRKPKIELHINGKPIPEVPIILILGLRRLINRKNDSFKA